jgi:hypothetical protein
MELFRVSRDVYGREVLQGASWDLFWVFLAAGVIFVVAHALYRWLLAPKSGVTGPKGGVRAPAARGDAPAAGVDAPAAGVDAPMGAVHRPGSSAR